MRKKKPLFLKENGRNLGTDVSGKEAKTTPIEIDIEEYGISKPQRIVVRARIVHDKS